MDFALGFLPPVMVSRAVRAVFFALSLSGASSNIASEAHLTIYRAFRMLVRPHRLGARDQGRMGSLHLLDRVDAMRRGVLPRYVPPPTSSCLTHWRAGMIWEMDPYYMPWVLCVAQPIVIAFSTFIMTGLVTTFSCSTFIFITKGGRTYVNHPLFVDAD